MRGRSCSQGVGVQAGHPANPRGTPDASPSHLPLFFMGGLTTCQALCVAPGSEPRAWPQARCEFKGQLHSRTWGLSPIREADVDQTGTPTRPL